MQQSHSFQGLGGHATCNDGVVDVGVEGDVAALVGLDVDVDVKVDTKPIVHTATDVADTTVKETKKAVDTVSKGTKKAAKKAKKAFKKLKFW